MNHKTHVGLDSPTLRPSSIEAVFKLIPFASHVAKPSADVCGGARPISLAQILCTPVGAPVSQPPDSVHSETPPMLCLKPMPETTAAKTVHSQTPPMLCLKPMPETTATKMLRHLYLFRRNEQYDNPRVWLQLKDFHRAIFPLSKTLERFPNAFWILPVPFDTQETAFAWQLRLECCSLFLHLIKDMKVVQLEALLLTFYWPEIQRKPELLDVLSTSNIALSHRDRVKKLASAWLLMHFLSLPVATRTSCLRPNCMPDGLFYRYVRMQLFLRTFQAKSLPKGRYMARHDVCGGSVPLWGDVRVLSALTGECVLSCSIPDWLEDDEIFLHLARTSAVEAFGLPYFALHFLLSDQLIEEEATWQDLGCPSIVTMVKKPKALDWADDLFDAIEKDDVGAVKEILKMGQDPDTTIINSALGTAVQQCNLPIVRMLVRAQANVNYVPPGQKGPLHSAVIHDAESCASFLLWQGANPNLEDNTAAKNTPLHYAAAYEDAAFADMLLAHRANPLKQNAWYSSPYTLARCCGPVVSLCLEYHFHRVDAATLLQGILSILAEYGCPSSLWCASKSFQSERPCWDVEGGSAVSFVLACTGKHICSLSVTEDCTILDLKQHVARHHGHLPFAVSLVLEGKVVPMGAIWAVVGFPPPPVLDVVLHARTNQYRLDLSWAVQEQQHDTIIAILSAGQEPNCSGIVRRTGRQEAVLLTAVGAGLFYCVHLLLSAFADPRVVGNDSRSALHLATLKNTPTTLQLLLDSRADVHVQDFGGETPLHLAAMGGNVLLVKQLLLAGADPLVPDARDQTPLLCCCDSDTRASLMDGCWERLSESWVTLFLLNARMLSTYRVRSELAPLCRGLRQCFTGDVCGGSILRDLPSAIQANRQVARKRKIQKLITWTQTGMELPIRGDGADGLVPFNYEHFVACQDLTTLAWLHPHGRDVHVRFEQENHEYFVDGAKTQGSVTGMIHAFSRPFDADAVIRGMMASDRWPRPNYLRPVMTEAVLQRVRAVDPSLLLALLDVPRNDPWICERVQALKPQFPDLSHSLSLGPDEIKTMWKMKGSEAAACGSYMHYLFEAHINGYAVPQTSPEFRMLIKFLDKMQGWRAYRTEWVVFAENENLAGSIDFCAVDNEGSLALIDWKRSANLAEKFWSPCAMLPPLGRIPDCAGSHYRLQLNAYRHIIEKYYGYKVSKMFIVGTHPDRQLDPFIDEVPRMEAEIEAIMKIWQQKAKDVCGGALDSSQPSQGRALSEQPCETQPEVVETQVKEEGPEDPDLCDVEDDPLLASVKKRRLMKGAQTTRSEFEDMFRQYHEWNEALVHEDKDTAGANDTILARVCELRRIVTDKYPAWSERLVRIGAAALAAYRARLSDRLFMGDNAFFLWLVEGDRFIRIHDGFCYIYNDNGAFMPYSGIPPQAVLARLALFFSQLEGIFRRMDPATRRNDVDILASIAADRAHFADEEKFLEACQEAAIWQQTMAPARDEFGEDADEIVEADVPRGNKHAEDWPIALGKRIWKICQSIRSELMHEKLISLLVEWCETPRSQKPCVSYHDTCVQCDVSREVILRHIPKAAGNDCYIFIPHPLLDPVLQQHQKRLEKFYQQTFWANNDVFQCNMAAMALAKRGFNVDRCFIGESPGGVGQSLLSLHIDAMLGSNHGYFDPNVWYNEDELRKQVESFARCIVVTGQEAPESHKRLHLDLFKKTMSGDGIAGRKPYGYTTRMFSVVGWKRLEVNRMMVFAGITKSNFQSVMRRALVWKPKARFHPESVLKQAHADHEEDGHFLADPTLKQFLVSPGACAAGLRTQHAFEMQHSQNECMHLIDDYATGGDGFLTEDKMRKACGLELRVRHEETAMGGVGLLHVSDSQEERDQEELQYTALRDFVVTNLLAESCSDITLWEFKKVYAQSSNKPNASHQTAFKELKTRKMMQKGCRKGKAKDVLQPVISCEVGFEDVIFSQRADEERVFPESMNTGQIRKYLEENPCRNNNVYILKQFFTECLTEEKRKKGRPAADDHAKKQTLQDQLCKLETYEKVCQNLVEIACPEAASQPAQTPLRRSRAKQPPAQVAPATGLVETSVRYKYSGDRKLRGRRYATQTSAQKCARRIQTQLFDHTIDLDIENCCATLVLQLLEKLKPNPPMPEEALKALRRWTDNRRLVCREELQVSDSHGKKLVTAWLSGGTPDKSFKDIPFARNIQRASIYLRWLACSVLAEDYEELETRSDKPYPGATAFFYMWSGVEDAVLEAWSDFLLLKRPTHLSLHFDGVRVNADVLENIDALISDSQDKIKERTGFSVRIRQKIHKYFMEAIASLDSTALDDVPPNC